MTAAALTLEPGREYARLLDADPAMILALAAELREDAPPVTEEAWAAFCDWPETYGWIYFFQQGDDGPVKVGFTTDPARRLQSLQTASAAELRCVYTCEGTLTEEQELLERLLPSRIRGEWFQPDRHFLCAFARFVMERPG